MEIATEVKEQKTTRDIPSAPRRAIRPRVRILSPRQLAPYKEQFWAINSELVEWSRAEFEATFDEPALYAVFMVGTDVVGHCTVMEQEFDVDGRRIFTIGLGRALVRPEFRNQFLVQRALIFRWIRRFIRKPLQPIYIWGNCVSYKSYLSFVRVLKIVYPVAKEATPARYEKVIDLIGFHWHGDQYDATRKAVRVMNLKMNDATVIPGAEDLQDADIRFYCNTVPAATDATYGLLTISPCIRSNFLPMVGSWVRNFVRKSLGMRKKKRK
jgi:hypothetical protein